MHKATNGRLKRKATPYKAGSVIPIAAEIKDEKLAALFDSFFAFKKAPKHIPAADTVATQCTGPVSYTHLFPPVITKKGFISKRQNLWFCGTTPITVKDSHSSDISGKILLMQNTVTSVNRSNLLEPFQQTVHG